MIIANGGMEFMISFISIAVTNDELLKEIHRLFKAQSIFLPLISSGLIAVTSIATTWLSNRHANHNMNKQLEHQRKLTEIEYQKKEQLQKHDFINRLILDKLTELSSLLPMYYREEIFLYFKDIYTYYNNKKWYGISDQRTIESGSNALRNMSKFANKLNTTSLKIKQLLAYSEESNRANFDKLDSKVAVFIINGLDKYFDDIKKGIEGELDPEEVRSELNSKVDQFSILFFGITKSIDNQIVTLIDRMRS